MRSGPVAKGPRLWLQPQRRRKGRADEAAVWVIRDDGGYKRSTGLGPADRQHAEEQLAEYIAGKHQPSRRRGDPTQTSSADVLALFARDVAPAHARPKETLARIDRLLDWWAQPAHSMRTMASMKLNVEMMAGTVADVRTSTCQAYVKHVGKTRTASMDLELFRAAVNHAVAEQVLERPVPFWLPPKSLRRERWLTRGEVATLVWAAWRRRRSQDGVDDEWHVTQHIAKFMVMAHYTGTRASAICRSAFARKFGFGFIDVDNGLWYRQATGRRATKKRQPPVRIPAPLLGHFRRWRAAGQTYPIEFRGQPVKRIDRAFRQLVKDCGLGPDVVVHTFRHTAITWAMQRGADPWQASGYFGLNLQTLTDNYAHHHPDHQSDVVAKMGRPTPIRRQGADKVSGTN